MWRSLCVFAAVILGVMVGWSVEDTPVVCPVSEWPLDQIMLHFTANLEGCILDQYNPEEIEKIMNPPDLETSRTNLKQFCNTTTLVETCLARLTPYAEACLTSEPHLLLRYKIYLDNWMNSVRVACSDFGERFALIFFAGAPSKARIRESCAASLKNNDTNTVNVSEETLRFYHRIQAHKKCVINQLGQDNESLSNAISSLITDISKVLQCAASDDVTIQYCFTLENTINQQ